MVGDGVVGGGVIISGVGKGVGDKVVGDGVTTTSTGDAVGASVVGIGVGMGVGLNVTEYE